MDLNKSQVQTILDNAPVGADKKRILDNLVLRGYNLEGVDSNAIRQQYQTKQIPQEQPSALERIQTGIQQKGEKIQQQIAGEGEFAGQTPLERGVGATATAFSALSGTLYNALPDFARNTLDQIGGGIGKGFNYLTDKISENPALQKFAMSEAGKDTEKVARVLADLGIISGEILGADQITKGITKGGEKIQQMGTTIKGKVLPPDGSLPALDKLSEKISSIPTEKASPIIMNKVARLNPKDAQTFQSIAGKTHGEYLAETGNFNAPDKIIINEAEKFAKSIKSVDDTLATLPGVYKTGPVEDMLIGLKEKALATSSKNVKSPYLQTITNLENKFNTEGLTMSEINNLKRLYEREVKLGYKGVGAQINTDIVKRATYVDDAVREWQVNQAEKLGFSNLRDLNKQTQISKFLVNKLGDKLVGQSGLNGVNLTDWIILSGGDPTSVAGFLTKKFFGSKSVQAKIAQMLNKGEIKGQIVPEITPTKPTKQPILKKSIENPSTKSTTPNLKIQNKIPKTNLINEAKKYKSAEEFVKANTYFRGEGPGTGTGNYYSTSKEFARDFTRSGLDSEIIEKTVLPNEIYKAKEIPFALDEEAIDNAIKLAKKDGKKAILVDEGNGQPNSIFVFDKSALKTKSEILNLFKKPNITTKSSKNGITHSEYRQELLKKYGDDFYKNNTLTKEEKSKLTRLFNQSQKTKSQLEEIWKKANKK